MNILTPNYEITQKLGTHSASWLYIAGIALIVLGIIFMLLYITERRYMGKKSTRRAPAFILDMFDIGYSSTKQQDVIRKDVQQIIYQSLFAMGIGTVLLYCSISYDQDYQAQLLHYVDDYRSKNYQTVEGILSVTPSDGSTYDVVAVGGQRFVIGGSGSIVSYNLSAAKGGLLRNGVYARIYYRDNVILRIDL